METSLMVILGVVVIIVLSLVIFYVLKFLKGNLKIILNQTSISPDETLSGSLVLKTKQEVTATGLVVSLVCYKQRLSYDSQGRKKTSWVKNWSNEVSLEGSRVYEKGFSNTYNFTFVVPNMSLLNVAKTVVSSNLSGPAKEGLEKVTGALSNYNNVTGNSKYKWKVEARLDADGVDLTDSKKIYVNSI